MNSSEKKYIKYKHKYLDLKQKQIMHGGNQIQVATISVLVQSKTPAGLTIHPEKKSDIKKIKLIFALGSATEPIKEILIDTINVAYTDTYDEILKKVNSALDKHSLTNVT